MSDLISRQAAIDALMKLQEEDEKLYGCSIPEGFDGDRAKEALEQLPSVQPEHATCYLDSPCEYQDINIALPSAQQWIPCSERLPETNGRYIVTRGLKACNAIWNRVYIINYSDLMGLKAEKIWWDGNVGKSDFQKIEDVIAWCELPEPYKGEQE